MLLNSEACIQPAGYRKGANTHKSQAQTLLSWRVDMQAAAGGGAGGGAGAVPERVPRVGG